MTPKTPKIGITMRIDHASAYPEARSAIAQDWVRFLTDKLPQCAWMLIPNLGPTVTDYVETWSLDGFILTGGNNLGDAPERDETETAILDYAVTHRLPVVGVCRGLQLIQQYFGGPVVACTGENHINTHHTVTAAGAWPDVPSEILGKQDWQVNSYHRYGVPQASLSEALLPLALSDDGTVEALRHQSLPVYAVQWHPERSTPSSELDLALLRSWLRLEAPDQTSRPISVLK